MCPEKIFLYTLIEFTQHIFVSLTPQPPVPALCAGEG
jgi:hypothetical protein